jgi:Zn-finger nucleic acid-binding protein
MNCPKCNVPLSMSDRSGVEIDYCPQCRGVWLDRGELDKIIERSVLFETAPAAPAQPAAVRPGTPPPPLPPPQYREDGKYRRRDHDDDDDDDYRHGQPGHRKKKKGFFGDLFDF